jgi:ABC-type glycerol-3-phosphate transport system substrate-binding protein
MGNQFDWQVDEDGTEPSDWNVTERPHDRNPRFWLFMALLILTLIIGSWGMGRWQLRRAQEQLRQQVQAVLDLEQTAVRNGDGDLFFALQTPDDAWVTAQLNPYNLARSHANRRVTEVEAVGEILWANITWTEGAEEQGGGGAEEISCSSSPPLLRSSASCPAYQQIAFFRPANGRLLHTATDPTYWGRNFGLETGWGRLDYMEVDEPWAEEMAAFTGEVIAETCATGCRAGVLPLTLAITPDWPDTAVPDRLHIPSPRLLALDAAGQPADLFWNELRRRLQNHLQPTTIRFAVPPELEQIADYEAAAQAFMAANPHIRVEIVPLTDPSPADLLAYDGAAFPVTEAMLASGQIADLTDYIYSDPDFAPADFYEQIWQGGEWHGRTWFLPYAAEMPVLFYDKAAYQYAQYPEPSLRWTWTELLRDMVITARPYVADRPSWGFLDPGHDALFSFAYSWENDCRELVAIRCEQPLTETAVTAAFVWYAGMVGEPGQMPNLVEIPAHERENLLINWQSANRHAVIWVDSPRRYEFQLLLAPLGVTLFPGSNQFDGVTPLHVSGHFISQQAENPRAVWEWLRFLSFWPPRAQFRLIPARPSVAESSQFWQTLPRELGNPMRIAFPFARPIKLAEQRYFTEEQMTAVLSGATTPEQAAHIIPALPWFGMIR